MEEHDPYVDIIRAAAGWFAVLWEWTNSDEGGFYDVEYYSDLYFPYASGAAAFAITWASIESVRCAFYGPVHELSLGDEP